MQIPINNSKPPLELISIRLYSTGMKGKVFTDRFYKSMNHNFGVEISVKNNTHDAQMLNVGGRIYEREGNEIIKWSSTKTIQPYKQGLYDFYVSEETFTSMKEGKYKVQFWLNGKKVQREFFTILYK